MRLLKFLSAGRSLIGMSNQAGRYRLSGKKSLPDFGNAKNPFLDTPPETVATTEDSRVKKNVPSPDTREGGADQAVTKIKAANTGAVGKPGPTGLQRMLRFLFYPAQNTRNARLGRVVQGEFSLDQVKVVRNDFLDAEFEARKNIRRRGLFRRRVKLADAGEPGAKSQTRELIGREP